MNAPLTWEQTARTLAVEFASRAPRHDAEGSFGLVLNRPIDMKVSDLMEEMPPVPSPVGIGGPVQSGNLFYLHTLGPRIEGSIGVVDDIRMGGDYQQLCGMLNAAPANEAE